MATLRDDEVEAFARRELELHCPAMRLRRVGATSEEISGPGLIRQVEDGQLTFLLYPTKGTPALSMHRHLGPPIEKDGVIEYRPLPLGSFVPEDKHFVLNVTDHSGRSWTAGPLLLDFDFPRGGPIAGRIRELAHTGPCEDGQATALASLLMLHEVRFTRDSDFVVADWRFTFKRSTAGHWFTARSAHETWPPNFDVRCIEALQFVTGNEIRPSLIHTRSSGIAETRLTTIPSKDRVWPRRLPPMDDRYTNSGECSRKIFAAYLQYIVSWKDRSFHPLSTEWDPIVRSDVSTIETQALVLSVAIESIYHVVFMSDFQRRARQENKDVIAVLKKWSRRILVWLDENDCPEPFRKRFAGNLGAMQGIRAEDWLRDLASQGLITESLIQFWKLVRNTSAHGDPERHQGRRDTVELLDHVLCLLYQLVFHAIGYSGGYIDYSTEGWQQREYPPSRVVRQSDQEPLTPG